MRPEMNQPTPGPKALIDVRRANPSSSEFSPVLIVIWVSLFWFDTKAKRELTVAQSGPEGESVISSIPSRIPEDECRLREMISCRMETAVGRMIYGREMRAFVRIKYWIGKNRRSAAKVR